MRYLVAISAALTLLLTGFASSANAATLSTAHYPWYGQGQGQGQDDRHHHNRGDRREKKKDNPVANPNCTLIVPKNPLSAEGLATPYQLVATNKGKGPCNEANADQSAFVEAVILDPANNTLSVYRPLVIDRGDDPAAAPVVPTLPDNAVVGIWFGFQGDNLKLRGGGVDTGQCVNGLGGSLFGQFAYCNAPAFFTAVKAANPSIPPLGTALDGQPCPTVRDFSVVDQDQSDNVSTVYRVTADGKVAQFNDANAAIGTPLVNASDNGLLNRKINVALGCQNFTAPDLTNPGGPNVPALALNELHADQQAAPIALIPLNDPMAKVGDRESLKKVNLYRAGVNQPAAATNADADGPTYCQNFMAIAPPRIELDAPLTAAVTSPDPAMNLHDFLVNRYQESLPLLGCNS